MKRREKRECQVCGRELLGRRGQKYCSDQCRTEYHNVANKDSSNFMRNINRRLRKNWRILKKNNPRGKAKVTKAKLIDEGFNFNYFTNIYKTRKGAVYYFCYDQGYLELENDWLALVERHGYVE